MAMYGQPDLREVIFALEGDGMASQKLRDFLESINGKFDFTTEDMRRMVQSFHLEMGNGLSGRKSSLKMLPAFVDRATGKEKGHFVALDLGGTNFRVIQVELDGRGHARVNHTGKFVIPNAVMRGTGTQLFNFIAQSIEKFILRYEIELEKKSKLGFTFSFPIDQKNIVSGILINWTKGFTATGVIGANVVKLLEEAIRKYGLENIQVAALANDTVGALAAKSYEDPDCDVGIIFGTGTNACYREKTANILKLKNPVSGHMIVNTEWGNYSKIKSNEYDDKLDRATNNPGRQRMEKMISGMYLGEVARLVLSDMIRSKFIFAGCKARFSKGNFKTRHMALVESDKSKDLIKIEGYLEGLGILDTTHEDRALLKGVCRTISRRAARISAAAISSVVTWMDPKLRAKHTVAIDGTLYEKYPNFRRTIVAALRELHGDAAKRTKLTQVKDGSGIGVAVVAAVASRGKSRSV